MRKNEKIKTLRKELGITQVQLAALMGVKQSYRVLWENGKRNPTADNLKKLAEILKVDYNYLSKDAKEEITAIPYEDYMMVEYVDLSASAGMLGGSNMDVLPDSKKRLVPREFERGNYLVVRVNGDSMTDGTDISIPDGVEILVKEYVLENGDKLPIRGNLFVVVSRDGNVFKQIVEHNTELGYIKCHSYNPKYEDYIIPMDDVFQIFIYRKIVGYRPNIPEIS